MFVFSLLVFLSTLLVLLLASVTVLNIVYLFLFIIVGFYNEELNELVDYVNNDDYNDGIVIILLLLLFVSVLVLVSVCVLVLFILFILYYGIIGFI